MITVKKANEVDVSDALANLRDIDAKIWAPFNALEAVRRFFSLGPAYTITSENGLVAVIGLAMERPGVGYVWMLTTDNIDKTTLSDKLMLTRAADYYMNAVAVAFGLRRIEAHVHPDHAKSLRWVKALGFQKEGLIRRYAPDGQDYFLLSRMVDSWVA